ncbi:hypothetical protein [Herbiconiux liangxiaofengii]|uniref:hypothetical protein n=1 Tax=Herbiconiux liangxiaofengii TaxID=3342795 RepID=UPI0035B71B1F
MFGGRDGGILAVLAHVMGGAFSIVVAAVAFLVVLGLVVLLVRFLWFGTRAAQVYLAKNGQSARFVWPVPPIRGAAGPGDSDAAGPKAPRKPKAPPSSP